MNGTYQLQIDEPYWMLEIGLGIGRYAMTLEPIQQEGLAWYNEQGNRYLTAEEKSQRLAQRLRELGEDPDHL